MPLMTTKFIHVAISVIYTKIKFTKFTNYVNITYYRSLHYE